MLCYYSMCVRERVNISGRCLTEDETAPLFLIRSRGSKLRSHVSPFCRGGTRKEEGIRNRAESYHNLSEKHSMQEQPCRNEANASTPHFLLFPLE